MTDSRFKIIQGDVVEVLRTLPAESIHCCVTSPPYWGLRDYGTGTWDGGDPACDHKIRLDSRADRAPGKLHGGHETIDAATAIIREQCPKCGARRIDKQIGLEETPEQYVTAMVEVFREVHRVLREDGTLWLNLGDSYSGSWGNQGRKQGRGTQRPINGPTIQPLEPYPSKTRTESWVNRHPILKAKDLIGIPWRVAFALQADGWYLRSDIIWHKPNPMPESVTDRPTKSHEYIFLLAKRKRYYYDADAVSELVLTEPQNSGDNGRPIQERRNRRTVWSINSYPSPEAHFATFPIELPEICILAGSPEDGVVLDPFSGAATTGLACLKTNRRYIGIELNPEYVEMAYGRARKHYPLLLAA